MRLNACSNKKEVSYTITGEISGVEGGSSMCLYLEDQIANPILIGSAPIISNIFTIMGSTDVPRKAYIANLEIEHGFSVDLILENTDYTLKYGGKSNNGIIVASNAEIREFELDKTLKEVFGN